MSEGKKRIYNPVTKKYYAIRQRTTKFGKKDRLKDCGNLQKGWIEKLY